jgi:hypothetical protein
MIASVMVPFADIHSAPPELSDEKVVMDTLPTPCGGYDACLGTDAGNTFSTSANITDFFDWDGTDESVSFFGEIVSTSSSYLTASNLDMYSITVPAGYGVTATLEWNHSSPGYYTMGDTYAYRLSIGGEDHTSYSTYSGGAWAYRYYSNDGELALGTDGSTLGNYGGTSSSTSFPISLADESMTILVTSYYNYMTSYNDYQITVDVWPADNGVAGDSLIGLQGPAMAYDSGAVGLGGSYGNAAGNPAGSSWSTVTDSYTTTSASEEFLISWTCDYWYGESSYTIVSPSGTSYSVSSFGGAYSTGTSGPYSDTVAGTWTITAYDSYGDGGIHLAVVEALGSVTGILTGDAFNLEDSGTGMVGSTDSSDIWALTIPDGYQSNVTLEWAQNADLDLYVFTNLDETGMLAYSWSSTPGEFVDLGGAVTNTTVYLKVDYYSWGSTSSWAGYELTIQLTPSVPPPCFVQDDAGSGVDAADDDTNDPDASPMDLTSMGDAGTIQGMLCDGYDDEDWYEFTLPAYHGLWARLDWTEDEGTGASNVLSIHGFGVCFNIIQFYKFLLQSTCSLI